MFLWALTSPAGTYNASISRILTTDTAIQQGTLLIPPDILQVFLCLSFLLKLQETCTPAQNAYTEVEAGQDRQLPKPLSRASSP